MFGFSGSVWWGRETVCVGVCVDSSSLMESTRSSFLRQETAAKVALCSTSLLSAARRWEEKQPKQIPGGVWCYLCRSAFTKREAASEDRGVFLIISVSVLSGLTARSPVTVCCLQVDCWLSYVMTSYVWVIDYSDWLCIVVWVLGTGVMISNSK